MAGHVVVVFLVLEGTSIPIPIVMGLNYTPTNCMKDWYISLGICIKEEPR